MSKTVIAIAASAIVLFGMLFVLSQGEGNRSGTSTITFFCAASNRAVMEEIRQAYEKETGRSVEIQYGPSQTLLSQIEVSKMGDLYLPADISYLEIARDKKLVAEILPIARMEAVLVVPKGNPKNIQSLSDLFNPDHKVVQANPDAAAIGKVTRRVLTESGQWEKIDQATMAYRTTVNDVANDVLVGAADVGIVYDAVLHTYPDLEYVEIQELAPAASQVSIGVIQSSKQPAAALHFARYVSAQDRGLKSYKQHGFRVGEGDQWSDVPELNIYAGSMLRPAIEDTIAAFRKREGVLVTTLYNGCGILVGQMKAGQKPDAYFACDKEFM
ncbi:MAG: molybdate ABC transporter substrate-binding protein, partial [Planctomycetota bacterium]